MTARPLKDRIALLIAMAIMLPVCNPARIEAAGPAYYYDVVDIAPQARAAVSTFSSMRITAMNHGGDVVGTISVAAGALPRMFLYKDGKLSLFDFASSDPPTWTSPTSVNDWGEVVGICYDSNTRFSGYFLHSQGRFAELPLPVSALGRGIQINSSGNVLHFYGGILVGGVWRPLTYASGATFYGVSLNNAGQILGHDGNNGNPGVWLNGVVNTNGFPANSSVSDITVIPQELRQKC